MTRIYKDDKDGNPVDVTDLVIGVPRGAGLSNMTTDRIANREPEVQYLKMGQDGETQTVYFDEAKELPHDDLIDAMYAAIDYSSVEKRMADYWLGLGNRPKLTRHTMDGKRQGAAKRVIKRRKANKAARKARRK